MSTPTPRTDAAWASSFEPCEYRAAHTARTMRDECAKMERELAVSRNAERLARVQLGAEREKVKALREACERLRDCDWVITLPDRMDAVRDIARAAIAATEEAK